MTRPDKYDTMQLAELLQQLLAHGGYYDEGLEFVRLERVQVRPIQ
jgi:dynein heavy chain 2